MQDTEAKTGWTVFIGMNYYGADKDPAVAKKNFQKAGGRLSRGYSILTFDEDTEYVGVDGVTGGVGYNGNAPTVTRRAARNL